MSEQDSLNNNREDQQVGEQPDPSRAVWRSRRQEIGLGWGQARQQEQPSPAAQAAGWGSWHPRRNTGPPEPEPEPKKFESDYSYFRAPGSSRAKWTSRRYQEIKELLPPRSPDTITWEPFEGLRHVSVAEFEQLKSIEEELRFDFCEGLYRESQEPDKFVRALLVYHKAVESWQRDLGVDKDSYEFPLHWIIIPEEQRKPVQTTRVNENYYQELRLQCWLYYHTLEEASERCPDWFIGDIQELYKKGLCEGGPLDKYINKHNTPH